MLGFNNAEVPVIKLARVLHIIRNVGACDTGNKKAIQQSIPEVETMWTKPDFTEMRFGFEITMYIGNR